MMTATQDNLLRVEGAYAGEAGDGMIVLAPPGTDYQHHLRVDEPIKTPVGKTITGHILARARRVDVVEAGGRFVEPVYGRPRRVQGRVLAVDTTANTVVVLCSCPFVCELTADQKARDFEPGQIVSFDVEPGARLIPLK